MRYEIKKIIADKILWVILILTVLMSVYVSFNPYINLVKSEIMSEYTGSYDENTVKEIENVLDNYVSSVSDNEYDYVRGGYMHIIMQINEYNEINDYRKLIVKRAERLKESEDSYISALNKKLYESYNKSIEFELYDTEFIEIALSNIGSYGTLMAVFFASVFAIRIFGVDTDNGVQSLIRSSKKGRLKVYLNKIKCLMAGNLILILITMPVLFLREFIYGNLTDFLQPVQSLTNFKESYFSINILELLGIIFIIQFIGMMIVSGISVIIACIFKKLILSLMVSVLTTSICYFLYRYIIISTLAKYMTFSNIFNDNRLFVIIISKFTNIFMIFMPHLYLEVPLHSNIFGIPVSTTFIAMVVNIFVMCLLMVLGFLIYNKRYRKNGQ